MTVVRQQIVTTPTFFVQCRKLAFTAVSAGIANALESANASISNPTEDKP